jgi:hypothetical protein
MIGKLTPPEIAPEPLPRPLAVRIGLIGSEPQLEPPPLVKALKETPKKPTSQQVDIPWLASGILLSLPTLFFAVVHVAYVPHKLPEFLDLPLAWILMFTGVFGPLLTVAALAACLAATFQKTVSWQAKVILWSVAAVSCIAWMSIVNIPA